MSSGTYALRKLGAADDYADANGVDVLTFGHAKRKALKLQDDAKRDEGVITRPVTVKDAADHYLAWFRTNRKSVVETEIQSRRTSFRHSLNGILARCKPPSFANGTASSRHNQRVSAAAK